MERNSLPLDVAEKRVAAQITNEARVEKAHVVLSTLWACEVTQAQVCSATCGLCLLLYIDYIT